MSFNINKIDLVHGLSGGLLRSVYLDDAVDVHEGRCPVCENRHIYYDIRVPVYRETKDRDRITYDAEYTLCLMKNNIRATPEQVEFNDIQYKKAMGLPVKYTKIYYEKEKKRKMSQEELSRAIAKGKRDDATSENTTPEEQAHSYLVKAQNAIDVAKKYNDSVGSLSDGYHTFNELYHHRAMLFAALCLTTFKNCAWKSLLHNDPKEPMYNGMFIVGIDTPFGQASYHYDIDPYWAIFKVKELDRAPKFDGHTPDEVIDCIFKYAKKIGTEPVTRSINIGDPGFYNIEPQLQYINEVDTTGTPVMRTGINISTTKKDDHNSTTLK